MQKTIGRIDYSNDPWTSEHEWEQLDRVYNAITVRWPSISLGEVKTINRNVADLVNFVAERVDTNTAEIESVVREFAPETQSTVDFVFGTMFPIMLLGFGIGYLALPLLFQSQSRGIVRGTPNHFFR